MLTKGNKARSVLIQILCVMMIFLLAGALCGCQSAGGDKNPFPAMAEAVVLSLEQYQDLPKAQRLKAIDGMTQIVFLSKEDLPLKPGQIDQQMMDGSEIESYDNSDPGSAMAAFCIATDVDPQSYLGTNPQGDVSTLEEAMALRINDLTARTFSTGVPGMWVLIDALNELDEIADDAGSAEFYAPMMALKIRAMVEDVQQAEVKNNYTHSGEIEYDEEGSYLLQLCRMLDLDFEALHPKMEELAKQQAQMRAENEAARAQSEAEQAKADDVLTQQLSGRFYSNSDWELNLRVDGSYTLAHREGLPLTIGGWKVKDGALLLGETPADITDEGILIDEIEAPLTRNAS